MARGSLMRKVRQVGSPNPHLILTKLIAFSGAWRFDGEGEQGMIDWGAIVLNTSAVAAGKTGLDALATGQKMVPGTCHAPYSMARTLGDPSGQTVATQGRKVMVSWIGNATFAAQSLPRDLALSPSGRLLQSFVPELRAMRTSSPQQSLQFEVLGQFAISKDGAADGSSSNRFGFSVLGVAGTDEATHVGVDLGAGIVFVDGRKSNSCDAMPWQCPHQLPHPAPPSPRAEGIYPAGPLLGSQTEILVHCYVDAVYVSCIFNNLTGKNTSNR